MALSIVALGCSWGHVELRVGEAVYTLLDSQYAERLAVSGGESWEIIRVLGNI